MRIRNALKSNLKTYAGMKWIPATDEIITQIIPLKYIDASEIQRTLSRIASTGSIIPYPQTNTLIVSDSGYNIRRLAEILEISRCSRSTASTRNSPY